MDSKTLKLQRFANDKMMFDAVYETVLATYLKARSGSDVHKLASERLAINLLEEAFAILARYADDSTKEGQIKTQVGL